LAAEKLARDGVCDDEAGGGANVTSASTSSVLQAAPLAITTFPVQHQQQQPTIIEPALLQQCSGE